MNNNETIMLDNELICNYFAGLVNHFFKILPMRENEESTLNTYMQSLRAELLGCQNVVYGLKTDPMYLSMLSILQYLIDNPLCPIKEVKREVFHAIGICNSLKTKYTNAEV